jgi:hypothetical protein
MLDVHPVFKGSLELTGYPIRSYSIETTSADQVVPGNGHMLDHGYVDMVLSRWLTLERKP